ncbi:MAG: CDP-alcohol phosphatidyltransferase family protein [Syntrophobacterales bacterium]|nr:MAG: CDP-alcohol phosphatidyltransferase family protein [Syntrophobacterales bacterium]
MISSKIGHRLDPYVYKVAKYLLGKNVNPNLLTFSGFILNAGAAFLLAIGYSKGGGLAILGAGLCDLMDGAMARNQGRATPFGAFFDSVMDRYSDLIVLLGILLFYARAGSTSIIVLTSVVLIGTALVPYVRARAEGVIEKCTVGLLERPERIVLLAVGALFDLMVPILWILAVFTHITVIQRIHYTWRQLKEKTDLSGGQG